MSPCGDEREESRKFEDAECVRVHAVRGCLVRECAVRVSCGESEDPDAEVAMPGL